MTDRGDSQRDELTGGGSRKSKAGLRRDSESSRGFNCDLLSLATVRSHNRGGRLQAENYSSDKEEKASCLGDQEGAR